MTYPISNTITLLLNSEHIPSTEWMLSLIFHFVLAASVVQQSRQIWQAYHIVRRPTNGNRKPTWLNCIRHLRSIGLLKLPEQEVIIEFCQHCLALGKKTLAWERIFCDLIVIYSDSNRWEQIRSATSLLVLVQETPWFVQVRSGWLHSMRWWEQLNNSGRPKIQAFRTISLQIYE